MASQSSPITQKFIDLEPRVWKDSGAYFVAHTHAWLEAAGVQEKPVDSALDLGCGLGRFALQLVDMSRHVVAADINRRMIEVVRDRARRLSVHDKLSLVVCDAQNLPFREVSFDLINMVGTLIHLPDQLASLTEISRIAKAKGKIIVDHTNYLSPEFLWDSLFSLVKRVLTNRSVDRSRWPFHRRCNFVGLLRLVRRAHLRVDTVYGFQVFPVLSRRIPLHVVMALDRKVRHSPLKFLGYNIFVTGRKAE